MFLSYYLPRHLTITLEDQWRELLVTLRTFHLFCVHKMYLTQDTVLLSNMLKPRRFKICQIPQQIKKLCEAKYLDSL